MLDPDFCYGFVPLLHGWVWFGFGQGWAAALANLEDIVVALERQRDLFNNSFTNKYLARREHYRQVIETFDDDLHLLSKIPVLPALYNDSGKELHHKRLNDDTGTFHVTCSSLVVPYEGIV
jgi:hypothetical protein